MKASSDDIKSKLQADLYLFHAVQSPNCYSITHKNNEMINLQLHSNKFLIFMVIRCYFNDLNSSFTVHLITKNTVSIVAK